MSVATQTTYNSGARMGVNGALADSGPYDKKTAAAAEVLKAGKAVVWKQGDLDKESVRLPQCNRITLVLSANFTSGTFQGTLRTTTLAGTVTNNSISVPFNTSHTQSMTDIEAAFDALSAQNVSATLTDTGGANRTVQITATNDVTLDTPTDFTYSNGTIAETKATTDVIIGFSGNDPTIEKDLDGEVEYAVGEEVPVQLFGRMFVDTDSAVTLALADTLYARFEAGTSTAPQERGTLTNTAGSPVNAVALPSGFALERPESTGTVVLDINRKGVA